MDSVNFWKIGEVRFARITQRSCATLVVRSWKERRDSITGPGVLLWLRVLDSLEGHCPILATLLVGLRTLSTESELEALTVHSLDQYNFALAAAPTPAPIPLDWLGSGLWWRRMLQDKWTSRKEGI